MPDYSDYVLIFLAGMASGVANVVAEAGSLIALPWLMLMGFSAAAANGTTRVVLFILNLFTLRTFYNRDRAEFKRSLRYAAFATPAAIIGSLLILKVGSATYYTIFGVVLLLVALPIVYIQRFETHEHHPPKIKEWTANLLMLLIGFYGGFIQAGVAVFLAAILASLLGIEEIRKKIYTVSILFAYLFPTSLIFVWTDNVEWMGVVVLLAGHVVGSWIGSTRVIRHNARPLRIAYVVATIVMGLSLLNVF